jgi:hypothetical protein
MRVTPVTGTALVASARKNMVVEFDLYDAEYKVTTTMEVVVTGEGMLTAEQYNDLAAQAAEWLASEVRRIHKEVNK